MCRNNKNGNYNVPGQQMTFSYNEYMYIQFYVHSFLLSLSYFCVCVLYQEKSIAIGMVVLMNTIKQMFEQVLSITSSSEKNFNGLSTRPHALAL